MNKELVYRMNSSVMYTMLCILDEAGIEHVYSHKRYVVEHYGDKVERTFSVIGLNTIEDKILSSMLLKDYSYNLQDIPKQPILTTIKNKILALN